MQQLPRNMPQPCGPDRFHKSLFPRVDFNKQLRRGDRETIPRVLIQLGDVRG